MDKNILINDIEKISTTSLGIERIKRNLNLLDCDNVVLFCKKIILDKNCYIYRKGKNWYCEKDNIIITINAFSYNIITAHLKK